MAPFLSPALVQNSCEQQSRGRAKLDDLGLIRHRAQGLAVRFQVGLLKQSP